MVDGTRERLGSLDEGELRELLGSLSTGVLRRLLADLEGDEDDAGNEGGVGETGDKDDRAEKDEALVATERIRAGLDALGVPFLPGARATHTVAVVSDGEPVPIHIFADTGAGIAVRSDDLLSFPDDERSQALELTATLNSRYRFARFCLDDDNTVHVEMDLPLCDEASCQVLCACMVPLMQVCLEARHAEGGDSA